MTSNGWPLTETRLPEKLGGLDLEPLRYVRADDDDAAFLLVLGRREEAAESELVVEDRVVLRARAR